MIFAEIQYDEPYDDLHAPLVALLGQHFGRVEAGLQGDSWIWFIEHGEKVSVDTFTSMHHQVKCSRVCGLVEQVLSVLGRRHGLRLLDPPVIEGHETLDDP